MSTNLFNGTLWLFLVLAIPVRMSSSNTAHNVTVKNESKPGCRSQCGNLTVRFPFGIGPGCSLNPSFSIVCDESYDPPKAFSQKLNSSSTTFRVFDIDISKTQILVSGMIAYNCPPTNGTVDSIVPSKRVKFLPRKNSPFTLSNKLNKFSIAGSCGYNLTFTTPGTDSEYLPCSDSCSGQKNGLFVAGVCAAGNHCCKKPVPATKSLKKGLSFKIEYSKKKKEDLHTNCGYAFFGTKDSFAIQAFSDFSDPLFASRTRDNTRMVVDWVIGNRTCREAQQNQVTYACQNNAICIDGETGGYRCDCREGYDGNPYLSPGCTDIDECTKESNNPCFANKICTNTPGGYNCSCARGYYDDGKSCIPIHIFIVLGVSLGLLLLVGVGSGANILIRKRRLAEKREKFFKENGGLMLSEKLSSSNRGSRYNSFKLFTIQELKNATKNFSKDLIVGIGGYGTVYKGTLRDGGLVAVKVSKVVDTTQIEQFINEMVILIQIHHRNVVKLLGCCLEAEIPILVYEFISNGSVFDHIHKGSNCLTWNHRLQIATETATALGHLHSETSMPIVHRDIKSANILLDNDYVAKISDFGTSRLIPMDKTQMSTLVQGTLGYMDPEYLLTSQLTHKSDVYSFGVMVAELLTGEKALSPDRRIEDRNLAKYFLTSFTKGQLFDIIDPRIVNEAPKEQLEDVAKILQKCLSREGANRPTMKSVAIQLAGLQKHSSEYRGISSKDWIREIVNNRSNSIADFSFTIEAR